MELLKSTDHRELFNMALKGVRKQGEPSYCDASHNCKYKRVSGEDGAVLKCGVGHCMTKDALSILADYDGDVSGLCDRFENETGDDCGVDNDLMAFLTLLQNAHDQSQGYNDFVGAYDTKMRALASTNFGHTDLDVTKGLPVK